MLVIGHLNVVVSTSMARVYDEAAADQEGSHSRELRTGLSRHSTKTTCFDHSSKRPLPSLLRASNSSVALILSYSTSSSPFPNPTISVPLVSSRPFIFPSIYSLSQSTLFLTLLVSPFHFFFLSQCLSTRESSSYSNSDLARTTKLSRLVSYFYKVHSPIRCWRCALTTCRISSIDS